MNKSCSKFLIFTLLCVCHTACHKQPPNSATHITIALATHKKQAWNLNSTDTLREIDLRALRFVTRTLFKTGRNFEPVPDLVDTYELSKANKAIALILKKINWSDGLPLTLQHVQQSMIRSLISHPRSPQAHLFLTLLPKQCQKNPQHCFKIKKNKLILSFRVQPLLALPFLTLSITAPQHPTKNLSKAGLGPYVITKQTDEHLYLIHREKDRFRPILLKQVLFQSELKKPFQTNKLHVIDPPPLSAITKSFWTKHLQAFPDFNLLILLQNKTAPPLQIQPEEISRYFAQKNLPLAQIPSPLIPLFESCSPKKFHITPTPTAWPNPVTILGPKTLFSALAGERIKKHIQRFGSIPVTYQSVPAAHLLSLISQKKAPYQLFSFRSQVPSLQPFLNLFRSKMPLAQQKSDFYTFTLDHYETTYPMRTASPNWAPVIRSLCLPTRRVLPLLSIPSYAIVHPRISKSYVRDQHGIYYFPTAPQDSLASRSKQSYNN